MKPIFKALGFISFSIIILSVSGCKITIDREDDENDDSQNIVETIIEGFKTIKLFDEINISDTIFANGNVFNKEPYKKDIVKFKFSNDTATTYCMYVHNIKSKFNDKDIKNNRYKAIVYYAWSNTPFQTPPQPNLNYGLIKLTGNLNQISIAAENDTQLLNYFKDEIEETIQEHLTDKATENKKETLKLEKELEGIDKELEEFDKELEKFDKKLEKLDKELEKLENI